MAAEISRRRKRGRENRAIKVRDEFTESEGWREIEGEGLI